MNIYILSFVIELFSQQHVLEIHSCCSMHQNFILFTVYGHTTFYLSIHQLTGIWVIYTFCFLLIIFLQSFMYRCRILFLLNIYHTCQCNDKLYSFFNVLRGSQICSKVAVQVYTLTSSILEYIFVPTLKYYFSFFISFGVQSWRWILRPCECLAAFCH